MTFMRWIVAVVLAAALAPACLADTAKNVALVVGNSDYVNEPHLKNPANDAKAMAAALRTKGFEVIEVENATKAEFENAIGRFGDELGAGATGLFYYAGHGMQVDGRNFLLPIDAKIQREERVRIEAIDADDVISQMTDAKAKVSMVILDACRNNPFEHRFRSVGGGLAQMNAPEGTFIAYATAPGSIAADGTGDHGAYTQALLEAMQQPGLKVEDVFKTVRINVSRITKGVQVPWESSSLTGDFYFTPAAPSSTGLAAQAELAKIAAARAELEREQAAFQLAHAGGGAVRMLTRGDAQGSFATTLPGFGRFGPIDVQINVQGHRVSGYGTLAGYPIPCSAIGEVEHTTIDFNLICTYAEGSGASNFSFSFKGQLAAADNGSPYFKSSYEGGADGTQATGAVDLTKVADDDVFGTYVSEITLPRVGVVQAVIAASDGSIAGFSTRGMPCKITGNAHGVNANFVLSCSVGGLTGTNGLIDTSFNGQFVREHGQYVFKSNYTTSDRETGTLVWSAKK